MSTEDRSSIAKLSEKVYRVVVILLPVVVLTPYQGANEVSKRKQLARVLDLSTF